MGALRITASSPQICPVYPFSQGKQYETHFQATRVCMCWDRAGTRWPVTPPARTVQGSTVDF